MNKSPVEIKGQIASRGMAFGNGLFLPDVSDSVPKVKLSKEEEESELLRFQETINSSRMQLESLMKESQLATEHLEIFEAHLMLMDDPLFVGETRRLIYEEHINAEWALAKVLENLKILLKRTSDPFFHERISDLEDVAGRLISNLMGICDGDLRIPFIRKLPSGIILLAEEIVPSLMLHLPRDAGGLAIEHGGITGHTAILARDRGIPALVGVEGLRNFENYCGDIFLDAVKGRLVFNPDNHHKKECESYRRKVTQTGEHAIRSPVKSLDGTEIRLWVNMDDGEDALDPRVSALHGVGLFRTEFIYLRDPLILDSPVMQKDIYRSVMERMSGRPVTFRLLDIGDDKTFHSSISKYVNLHDDLSKGLRGIRFLLANLQLLRMQLSAIFRAALEINLSASECRILVPMISTLEELQEFKRIQKSIKDELAVELKKSVPDFPVGIMVETPAACAMAGIFSKHADFFSIGTNDLAQYTLAFSRAQVNSQEFQFYQPSVFRMIKLAADLSTLPLAVCGEMSSVPELIPVLMGIGIRDFSTSIPSLALTAEAIRTHSLEECKELADSVLNASSAREVRAALNVNGDS